MKFDRGYLECVSPASNLIGDKSTNKAVAVNTAKSRTADLDWLKTTQPLSRSTTTLVWQQLEHELRRRIQLGDFAD